MLRLITDGRISPEEAVRAYHGVLQAKGIKPNRQLEQDMLVTDQAMSYDGSATRKATAEIRNNPLAENKGNGRAVTPASSTPASKPVESHNGEVTWPKRENGAPDFDKMTSLERNAYDEWRLKRIYG